MKIRNEIKVGLLAFVSIALLIWGYYFLKGNNILSRDIIVTAQFSNVDGLDIGAPITVKGFRVGAVTDLRLNPDNPSMIIAELNINRGTKIPDDAVAVLVTPSLMSGKAVTLEYTTTCSGEECLESGEEIKGRAGNMFEMAEQVFKPYIDRADSLLTVITEVAKEEEGGFRQSVKEIQATITNLKMITDVLSMLSERSSSNLVNTIDHLEAITKNIRKNNNELSELMANVNAISGQLKDAELDKTIASTKITIDEFGKLAGNLQGTLDETNKLLKLLQSLSNTEGQEGLLGALMHDKQMLGDVKKAIKEVNSLVTDIKLHPERYRTILSGKYKHYIEPDKDVKFRKGEEKVIKKGGGTN